MHHSFPACLNIVSYLAPNGFYLYEAVAQALGQGLGVEIRIRQGEVDLLDDPMFLMGKWDVALVCGLPLMRLNRQKSELYQPISAPVMQGARYQNLPIYFADVIVPCDSPVSSFDELQGKVFCYNDLGSNSGYFLLHTDLGPSRPSPFFGQSLQSGSHQTSIPLGRRRLGRLCCDRQRCFRAGAAELPRAREPSARASVDWAFPNAARCCRPSTRAGGHLSAASITLIPRSSASDRDGQGSDQAICHR